MKNLLIILLFAWFTVSCGEAENELPRTAFIIDQVEQNSETEQTEGSDQTTETADTSTENELEPDTSKCGSLEDDECLLVSALYRHCASCHGIGNKRFIYDDSYENTFEYILSVNYEENKTWAKAIKDSIDWVDGVMPEYGVERESEKQFMPLGKKRQHMNEERIGGEPVQKIMMEVLNKYTK